MFNNAEHPGKLTENQSISLCMIVKNEEEFLEKCLTSVGNYMDEIIIVDTGSTDNTVEIAKRFTNNVYFHPWENSFSKARNQALHYATGDWVFQMDADEELMAGSGERIRHVIKEAGDADIIYVNLFCSYAKGEKISLNNYERIFRNNGKIHYAGNIHEQVLGGTKAFFSTLELWHRGYDVDEEKAREKFTRSTDLLKVEIKKDPDNPIHHHYLSSSYLSRGMNEEAIGEAVRAVELSNSLQNAHDFYAWSHFIASMAYYRLGRLENAKKYALKSMDKYPGHIDSYYMLTIISADNDRWDDVIRYGKEFLKIHKHINSGNKDMIILENTMNEGPGVSILVGHAFYSRNSSSQMEKYYKNALEMTDQKWQVLWNIGIFHMDRSGDLDLAMDYLERAVREAPDEHEAWYMLAKLNKKRGMKKEEMKCLERIVTIGTDDSFVFDRLLSLYITQGMPNKAMSITQDHSDKIMAVSTVLCRIALLMLEKGNTESAINCYMMALEKDPHLFEAWESLGEITLNLNRLQESQVFFQKALELNKNDAAIMLGLCDIGARKVDIDSIVKYCDMLLNLLDLPRNRTIAGINDLKGIFMEIDIALGNKNLSARISDIIRNIITPQKLPGEGVYA